ncbi:predicted protein [Sclerotinia sclerotiorum 1980 UF-70]|uniref:Uncharacterized protein n=1 Tax=Sclerotinia sclerotiorum (strain ATCC 18683 / 1980 / Ss-1) TaxID=665079 RepID=A7EAJ8_SCLS1|nr:predicted protein [Sclerotinia sclerotiorum 1980 UF-70]EDN99476.1 predicted protein [Sclerotinia sclerotiorum 1980 UF-70]
MLEVRLGTSRKWFPHMQEPIKSYSAYRVYLTSCLWLQKYGELILQHPPRALFITIFGIPRPHNARISAVKAQLDFQQCK